jgi:hypothetical protein
LADLRLEQRIGLLVLDAQDHVDQQDDGEAQHRARSTATRTLARLALCSR